MLSRDTSTKDLAVSNSSVKIEADEASKALVGRSKVEAVYSACERCSAPVKVGTGCWVAALTAGGSVGCFAACSGGMPPHTLGAFGNSCMRSKGFSLLPDQQPGHMAVKSAHCLLSKR